MDSFKHCPKCAGDLKQKNKACLACVKCGFEFYLNPKTANATIIENEKKEICLIRRAHEPFKGTWDLPGGFVDPDETLEESARREIKEEIGIEISDIKYFASFTGKYPYQNMVYDVLCLVFTAKISGQHEFSSDDEVAEIKFFPLNKIPYENIKFEETIAALREYVAKR